MEDMQFPWKPVSTPMLRKSDPKTAKEILAYFALTLDYTRKHAKMAMTAERFCKEDATPRQVHFNVSRPPAAVQEKLVNRPLIFIGTTPKNVTAFSTTLPNATSNITSSGRHANRRRGRGSKERLAEIFWLQAKIAKFENRLTRMRKQVPDEIVKLSLF